jgi:hypothetical protein
MKARAALTGWSVWSTAILSSFSALVICAQASAAPDPAGQVQPTAEQGKVSASGSFSPATPPQGASLLSATTPAEAEALLKQALKVEQTGSNTFRIGQVGFDREHRTVTVPASVNTRTQVVEYALVNRQGKTHESLFSTEAKPSDLHLAFLLLGISPVPVTGEPGTPAVLPETNVLRIEVSWQTNNQVARFPLSSLVLLQNGPSDTAPRPFALERWLYNGSVVDRYGFAAQREGSMVSLIRDPTALVNNPGTDRDDDNIHFPNRQVLPPEGWPVQVELRLPERPVPPKRKAPPWASPITPLSTNSE